MKVLEVVTILDEPVNRTEVEARVINAGGEDIKLVRITDLLMKRDNRKMWQQEGIVGVNE